MAVFDTEPLLPKCEFTMHGTWGYGRDEFAVQYVRETCAHCDQFKVKRWCKGCLEGVKGSGRQWRCQKCQNRMSPDVKLNHVVRMGDL
jgi:hypothetical protein